VKVGNEQRQIRRFGVFLMHRGLCGDVIDKTLDGHLTPSSNSRRESKMEYTTVEARRKRRKFSLMYNDIPNGQMSVPKSRKEPASVEDQTSHKSLEH
jgi:hypothetical protein